MARIPTTVVTGFLGAGKTTLIRSLLENAGGRRLAVVVNESNSAAERLAHLARTQEAAA